MDDIYFNIFTFLHISNIPQVAQVNKQFNNITKMELLWKHYYDTFYINETIINTYYETCIYHYKNSILNLKSFAISYNILRMIGGMKSLSYSN